MGKTDPPKLLPRTSLQVGQSTSNAVCLRILGLGHLDDAGLSVE